MKQQCSLCGSIDLATVFPLPLKNLGRSKYTAFTPTSSDFGIFYKLARCRSCGMQFAVLDGKDDIRGLYRDSSDTVYLAQEQDRGIAYKRIISELKAFMPAGSRLLDIGCSYGFFIKAAKASGFSVYGVEASSHAAEYCRKQGLGVFSGEIRQAEMPPESFDIICAIEVIEHLEDIRSFISEV